MCLCICGEAVPWYTLRMSYKQAKHVHSSPEFFLSVRTLTYFSVWFDAFIFQSGKVDLLLTL